MAIRCIQVEHDTGGMAFWEQWVSELLFEKRSSLLFFLILQVIDSRRFYHGKQSLILSFRVKRKNCLPPLERPKVGCSQVSLAVTHALPPLKKFDHGQFEIWGSRLATRTASKSCTRAVQLTSNAKHQTSQLSSPCLLPGGDCRMPARNARRRS